MRLARKVALVTGGGSGIGAAIARRFAAEGASVVLMGRRPEPIVELARELSGLAVPGDVGVQADARRAVAATVEGFGGLDVLVNNAGVSRAGWEDMLRIHLTGAHLLADAAVPRLLERGGGSIVNVASVSGLLAAPAENPAYWVAKAGLIMLTRSLAVTYGRQGIRANAVCPGWVRTPATEAIMDDLAAERELTREEAFDLVVRDQPLGRVADPGEIASVCAFLASGEASFVTGAVLTADGGSTAVDVGLLAWGER